MLKSKFSKALISLVLVMFVLEVCSAYAQPVPYVAVELSLPDGTTPAPDVLVTLINRSTLNRLEGKTNNSGTIRFSNVESGNYRLQIKPSQEPNLSNNGTYRDIEENLSIDLTQAVVDNHTGFLTQTILKRFSSFPKTLLLQYFFPKAGALNEPDLTAPITDVLVDFAKGQGANTPIIKTTTDSNGEARIGLEITDEGQFFAKVFGRGVVSRLEVGEIPLGITDQRIQFISHRADAVIAIQLQDAETGNDYTLTDQRDADVVCDGVRGQYGFRFESIPDVRDIIGPTRLDGRIIIPAISGLESYRCQGSIKDANKGIESLSFSSLAPGLPTSPRAARVYSADSNLDLRFRDWRTGVALTDFEGSIAVFSEPLGRSGISYSTHTEVALGESSVSIPVRSAVRYQLHVKPKASGPGEAPTYVLAESPGIVDMTNGGTVSVNLRLAKPSATLRIRLSDAEGSPIARGLVKAFAFVSGENGANERQYTIDSFTGADGQASLSVVPGLTYEVRARAPETLIRENNRIVQPAPQRVLALDQETVEVQFALSSANYDINITPEIQDQNGNVLSARDARSIHCGVRNAIGERSGNDRLLEDGTVTVSTRVVDSSVSETIGFGCQLVFDTEDDGLDGEVYFGKSSLTTKNGEVGKNVSLTIRFAGTFFERKREQFSPDEEQNITFPDGRTEIRANAGAFGSTGTTVVLDIETAEDWELDTNYTPIAIFEVTPTLDGEVVEELEQSVQFCVTLTEEELESYGVDISAVTIASEIEGEWVVVPVTVNGNTVCAEVDHFSTWGAILDAAKYLKTFTPDLRGKLRKGWAVLSWSIDSESLTGDEQFLLEYTTKARSKKKCAQIDEFPESEVVTAMSSRIRVRGGGKKRSSAKRKGSMCARVSYNTPDENRAKTSNWYQREK
ncbi:MAG: hypothetical protein KDD70_12750 [Bdellovibrionales bacterium]|nr:hypothetical protein [Bdellovibrionales bacterium]